jgi:hypothetical protein
MRTRRDVRRKFKSTTLVPKWLMGYAWIPDPADVSPIFGRRLFIIPQNPSRRAARIMLLPPSIRFTGSIGRETPITRWPPAYN